MSKNIINVDLGPFPTDPAKAAIYMQQLLQNMKNFEEFVQDKASYVVRIEQAAEPTQTEWEMAWLVQTGRPMPMSKGAIFIWWDSTLDELGGMYGILKDDTTVRRRDPKYVRGGIVTRESTVTAATVDGVAYLIGTNLANHPSLSFTCNQEIDLEIEGIAPITYNSGTADVGMDFILDGERVGTRVASLSDDQAIFNLPGSGVLHGIITVPGVSAGAHTVQTVIGSLASVVTPSNIDIGIQTLALKGYVG